MSKNFVCAAIATICVALCISPIFADKPEKGDKGAKATEKTPAEIAEAEFKKIDTNGDSSISLDEYKVWVEARIAKMKEHKEKEAAGGKEGKDKEKKNN